MNELMWGRLKGAVEARIVLNKSQEKSWRDRASASKTEGEEGEARVQEREAKEWGYIASGYQVVLDLMQQYERESLTDIRRVVVHQQAEIESLAKTVSNILDREKTIWDGLVAIRDELQGIRSDIKERPKEVPPDVHPLVDRPDC